MLKTLDRKPARTLRFLSRRNRYRHYAPSSA